MKRRVGALLMALALVMTGIAAYAEEDNPAEVAVEDSVEDASAFEGEAAAYEEELSAVEESAEAAEPEATPEVSQNVEAEPEPQTTVIEETQSEAAIEPEVTEEVGETEEFEEDIETYTALSGDLSVTVEVPVGALPENVLLYMQSVDAESDEYEEAYSYVQEQEGESQEASNLEIVDLYFTLDGEKIDPTEAVTVKLGLTEFANADKSSLQAWDYMDRTEGTFNTETEEVEFVTVNLQTFAVAWEDGDGTDAYGIYYLDDDSEPEVNTNSAFTIDVIETSSPDDGVAYRKGEELTYQVEVKNNWDVDLYNIEVKDGLTSNTWEIDSLSAGESCTPEGEASYTVTANDAKAGSVTIEGEADGAYISDDSDPENPVLSTLSAIEYGVKTLASGEPELTIAIKGIDTSKVYTLHDEINYTITVTNTGEVDISDIVVTYPLNVSSKEKWTIESLKQGDSIESETITYTVTDDDTLKYVYDDDYAYATISVTAEGVYESTEKRSWEAEGVTVQIEPKSSQKFVETGTDKDFDDAGEKVTAGDEIIYLITYKNTGDKKTSINITDKLDSGLEYVSSNPEGEYIPETGTVKWTINHVAPNTEDCVTLTVKVVGNDKREVENYARVDGTKTNTVSNPLKDDTPQDPTKTVNVGDGTAISVEDKLTYTITYYNHHADAQTVTITDTLDKDLVFDSATNDGSYDDAKRKITWKINAKPFEEGEVNFTAKFVGNENGKVENIAEVKIGKDGKKETNPVSNALGTGESEPDTEPESEYYQDKFVDTDGDEDYDDDTKQVYIGNTLKYKIVYRNTDTETKTLTITDWLDEGLTYVDGSASDGGTYASGTITWKIEAPPFSESEVTFEATVNEANLKTEVVEEDEEDIYKTDIEEDDDDDGEDKLDVEEDRIISYVTVTYKDIYNFAVVQIGDEEETTNTVWNYVYSKSTSSGSGSGSDGVGSGENESVKTADDTPTGTMLALFGAAIAVLGADIIYRRRRIQR